MNGILNRITLYLLEDFENFNLSVATPFSIFIREIGGAT